MTKIASFSYQEWKMTHIFGTSFRFLKKQCCFYAYWNKYANFVQYSLKYPKTSVHGNTSNKLTFFWLYEVTNRVERKQSWTFEMEPFTLNQYMLLDSTDLKSAINHCQIILEILPYPKQTMFTMIRYLHGFQMVPFHMWLLWWWREAENLIVYQLPN